MTARQRDPWSWHRPLASRDPTKEWVSATEDQITYVKEDSALVPSFNGRKIYEMWAPSPERPGVWGVLVDKMTP